MAVDLMFLFSEEGSTEEKATKLHQMLLDASKVSPEELYSIYAELLKFVGRLDIPTLKASLIYPELKDIPDEMRMPYIGYRKQLKVRVMKKPGLPQARKEKWVTLLEL